jgi:hypothetical protein
MVVQMPSPNISWGRTKTIDVDIIERYQQVSGQLSTFSISEAVWVRVLPSGTLCEYLLVRSTAPSPPLTVPEHIPHTHADAVKSRDY